MRDSQSVTSKSGNASGNGKAGIDPLAGIFPPSVQLRFVQIIALAATASLSVGFIYSSSQAEVDFVRRIAFGIALVGFLLSFVVTTFGRSAQWGAAIVVITGIAITLVPAYYEGGVASPYGVWFLIVPLMGGLLLGPRIAYVAGISGALAMLVLGLSAELLPEPEGGQDSTTMMTFNLVLAILFCTGLGVVVSRLMTRSSLQLMASRNTEVQKNLALEEINEQFEGSVRVASDAIIMAGPAGIIEVFNPAAEAIYGFKAEDAIGEKIAELIIPERLRDDHYAGLKRYLDTGIGNIIGIKVETFSIRADGSEFPVELTVQEIPGRTGVQLIAFIRDLTERNKLRNELAQKEKQIGLKRRLEAIGRLSGGVAHDFNNLLMAINGYAELLMLRKDLPEEVREGLSEIGRAGEQANSITKQLLAFSRRDQLEAEHVNLTRIVSALTDMLGRVLPDSVTLEIDCEPEAWLVRSEGARLEQAILNLILNAADAMPQGGTVQLRTRNTKVDDALAAEIREIEVGDYCCIEVSDNGTGMDAETLEHIFDPFFTTKSAGEGTGLGLSTTYGIVQQSGGAIEVKSELGVGSKFRIYLPRAADLEEYYTEPDQKSYTETGGGETVLVVEDEPSVRNLVVRTLADQGYHVIEANNGQRGYDLALRHLAEIDLVVTDVVMPRLGGADMVRRLRLSIPHLKVIFVSGHSEDELESSDIANPRTEFLYKPFNLDVLAATVKRLLSTPPPDGS